MDFLKAEIAKRKAATEANGAPAAKHARHAEPAAPPAAPSPAAPSPAAPSPVASAASPLPPNVEVSTVEAAEGSSKPEAFNISNEEAVRRLRQKGQPIRLFAEGDRDRRMRVRALELMEQREAEGGQRNDFMRTLEKLDSGLELFAPRSPAGGARARSGTPGTPGVEGEEPEKERGETIVDLALLKTDPHKLYPHVYWALKKVLREWEASMDERPESVKRSTQGKLASATQKQSGDYLKPLFKALRKRDLQLDVLTGVAEIVYHMQVREYVKANDAYLKLSIGNAAWPIGVTMVGIHDRSAREKIGGHTVAHVLNDETSRKYIQSLKRLLTFAQIKYPPFDHAQRMG